jgi:hypothetical protein
MHWWVVDTFITHRFRVVSVMKITGTDEATAGKGNRKG